MAVSTPGWRAPSLSARRKPCSVGAIWSIANAKTISNNYGEIKIDKDITTERIDPIDAIIDAWKHAMKEEYRPDVNETVNEWLEQFEKYMKKGGEK